MGKVVEKINNYNNHPKNKYKITVYDQSKYYVEIGTSWLYSTSSAVYLSLLNKTNSEQPTSNFEEIRENLRNIIYHKKDRGARITDCLNAIREYNLSCRRVRGREAREGLNKGRVCLCNFWLSGKEWNNFEHFFISEPTGILSRQKIEESINQSITIIGGGHAVVLVDEGDNYLEFMNSWGRNWADNGFFKIKDSSVLNDLTFYEIY